VTTPKYPGTSVFLTREADGQWSLYNFYHKRLGRGTLQELLPVIEAHHIPQPALPVDSFDFDLDLDDLT